MTAAETVVMRLSPEDQAAVVEEVRGVLEKAPLVRPVTPNGMPMRVRVSAAGRFGWVGDGAYRYDATQADGRPWPEIPERWVLLANIAAGVHPWDSAIINWYSPDAALGWHQDLAEHDHTLPIVTISLGDACSWAIRLDESDPVTRCRLESGDVTLLAGRTRLALHTVERIIAAPLFSPLKSRGRISITLRVAGVPS
jgi:alkylated DNA repair protein (DNA oxidative demethylase)